MGESPGHIVAVSRARIVPRDCAPDGLCAANGRLLPAMRFSLHLRCTHSSVSGEASSSSSRLGLSHLISHDIVMFYELGTQIMVSQCLDARDGRWPFACMLVASQCHYDMSDNAYSTLIPPSVCRRLAYSRSIVGDVRSRSYLRAARSHELASFWLHVQR